MRSIPGRRRRPTTALAGAAIAVAAIAVPVGFAGSAQAATTGPVVDHRLGLASALDLAVAGGTAFVSSGSSVLVYDANGTSTGTIAGLPGAHDLVLSGDKGKLYVTESGASGIAVVDVATRKVTETLATGPCPTSLALSKDRLFYSYGCQSSSTKVTSVPVGGGAAGPELSFRNGVILASGGGTLAIADAGSSPTATSTYSTAADGTLTQLATTSIPQARDIAVSPDGTSLVTTEYGKGYGVARYDTATLQQRSSLATEAYPSAVAWTADGTKYVVGHDSDTPFWVFSDQGVEAGRSGGSVRYSVVPGTLSVDGTRMAALYRDYSAGTVNLVEGSTVPAKASTVSVTATSARRPGDVVRVTVSSNRPSTRVSIAITDGSGTRTLSATTDGAGTATVGFKATTSGQVTASVPATLSDAAATSTARSFQVKAVLSSALGRPYKTVGGVAHFHRSADVRPAVTFKPARTATLSVRLQVLSGRTWRSVATQSFTTSATGRLPLKVTVKPRLRYRVLTSFAGDQWNSAAASSTSRVFTVD